uniref:methenyltetrahydrofolate cyclohydrolase n=1 Tax=Aegilops tauschii subsp. strangulata TaxID=200361 RepID=A0A453N143_AEGTS
TPKGCMELLHRSGVEIKGKRAVVIGRSNIVGTPAALLLQKANATVSIVHSKTKNPEEITRQPGAAIIDVGINPVDDPASPRGYRLVGDVCFEEA